jgi:hypothetical protein
LKAYDLLGGITVVLTPGAILTSSHIRPSPAVELEAGAEPYMMEFDCYGRTYRCALAQFQPRTRMVDMAASGEVRAPGIVQA